MRTWSEIGELCRENDYDGSDGYSIEDPVIVYPVSGDCTPFEGFDPFVTTKLDLDNYLGRNYDLKSLLKSRRPKSEIDVRIKGTLKKAEENNLRLEYLVVPTDIEVISPWRKFFPKAAA